MDTDPQGAIGLSLDGVSERVGLAAAIKYGESALGSTIQTRLPELRIIPMGPVAPHEVDSIVQLARARHAAGLGGMTRLALEAVEHVIAVVQCEPLALRSLPQLLEKTAPSWVLSAT